ncbi:MAG TPA: cytochrome c oxidase subunit 3 [Longimicrobiaceae bacterium]|nr:cytochrome c oxidase subunit 3 [Longimicrobiaceae bacterium]
MTTTRTTFDASALPTVVIGRGIGWWGTIGFMVIEGTTLAVCAVTDLYLRKNFPHWPPLPIRPPDLVIPTINLVVILLCIVPMNAVSRAAKRLDRAGVKRWLACALVLGLAAVVLRYFEFGALNVRWDANAYGSIAWTTIGVHASLLLVDFLETATILAIFFSPRFQDKYYADAVDAAVYQYFLSLVWVPLYVIVFLAPYW